MLMSLAAGLSVLALVFGVGAHMSESQVSFGVLILLFWIVTIAAGALFILGAFVRQQE